MALLEAKQPKPEPEPEPEPEPQSEPEPEPEPQSEPEVVVVRKWWSSKKVEKIDYILKVPGSGFPIGFER
jgi:hypothetical protein